MINNFTSTIIRIEYSKYRIIRIFVLSIIFLLTIGKPAFSNTILILKNGSIIDPKLNKSFFLNSTAQLGTFVWEDLNANGTQDADEVGLPDVVVRLFDDSGNQLAIETTNALGFYQFINLAPGTYQVKFEKPQGYESTIQDNLLVTGEIADLSGVLSGIEYIDLNNNGTYETGVDAPVQSSLIKIYDLYGTLVDTTMTDTNGVYVFTDLEPDGVYNIEAMDENKDSDADPATGLTQMITLALGENNPTIDAGFFRLARIGNLVWEDIDRDGWQDGGEPGIKNVTISLTGTDGFGRLVNATVQTDTTGGYEFSNLVPGKYVIEFTLPNIEYLATPQDASNDDAMDSDADPITGLTQEDLLSSGQDNTSIDAGFYKCSTIGNYLWLDLGSIPDEQDAGDVGLNGIQIDLFKAPDFVVPLQTTTTMSDPNNPTLNGYYNFDVCDEGTYMIKVAKPADYIFVQPHQGSNNAQDSDIVDFNNESTLTFALGYAQKINDIDIGFNAAPLPIKLIEFVGRRNVNKNINELSWTTSYESNNNYFEVERSINDNEFLTIAKVDAKGLGSSTQYYSLDDTEVTVHGKYIYRLKQVDFEEKNTYSNNVEIDVTNKGKISTSVYPNPSASDVHVEINGVEGAKVSIILYDNYGKHISTLLEDGYMHSTRMITTIDKSRLSQGIYMIQINVDGQITKHKLIIIDK